MLRVFIVAVAIIFCFLPAIHSECDILAYNRVRLVDKAKVANGNTNFLFRGNMPLNKEKQFDYDNLMKFISGRAAEAGEMLNPNNTQLLVISFNGEHGEVDPDTAVEVNFFLKHPELGTFKNWVLGIWYTNPLAYSDQAIRQMVKNPNMWSPDNLPDRISQGHEILQTMFAKPLAIYVHCSCGCDRTGEFVGTYVQQYLKWDYNDTITFNDECGRDENPASAWGVQWFCFYLHYQVRKLDTPADCGGNYTHGIYPVGLAAYLDDQSRSALLQQFPPALQNVNATSMLVNDNPSFKEAVLAPYDTPIYLTVVGYANDTLAQVVVVRASDKAPGDDSLPSTDAVKHITISTAAGVPADYPNQMLKKGYQKLPEQDFIPLLGRVKVLLNNGTIFHKYY